MEKYFMLSCSEDGDVRIYEYDKDSLLKTIEDYSRDTEKSMEFSDKIEDSDPQCWRKRLLIKGEIVCPKPIEVVKFFDID